MGSTLLTFFVYLSAVEGVRSSFQSQFVQCCQCMVAARSRLYCCGWWFLGRVWLEGGYLVTTRWCVWVRPKADID